MAQLTLLPQPPATAPLICTVARTRLIIVLSQRLIRLGISNGVIGVQRPISSLFIGRPGILLAYPIAFYKQTKKKAGFGKTGKDEVGRGIKSYNFVLPGQKTVVITAVHTTDALYNRRIHTST